MPSIAGIIPYAGIDLAANSVLKDLVSSQLAERGEEPGVTTLLGCGMASSTLAMMCTYPLNVIRTRLQASGMPGSPSYTGFLDCFKKTVADSGLTALYRGAVPNL